MKTTFFLLTFLNIVFVLNAQNLKKDLINAVSISLNKTGADSYFDKRDGFGIGIYHNFSTTHYQNFIIGLEFDQARQFIKIDYISHALSYSDMLYQYNYMSFPVKFEFSTGRRVKLFFNMSTFTYVLICGKRAGTKTAPVEIDGGWYVFRSEYINEFFLDKNLGIGFSSGVGFGIPIKKKELTFNIDYKIGGSILKYEQFNSMNSMVRFILGFKFIS